MLHTHLFRDLAVFVEIAECKSFSRAAVALGMPVSSLSRRLRGLEEALGQKLIERTTRRLELTRAGKAWLPQIAQLMAEAEGTIVRMRAARADRELLTIAMPNEPWAIEGVVQALVDTRCLEQSRLRFSLSSQPETEENADIAVVCRPANAQGDQRRDTGAIRSVLVAAPDYLVAHGEPRHPNALAEHRLILTGQRDAEAWIFSRGCERVSQTVTGLITSVNASVALRLVRAGIGIAIVDRIIAEKDLKAGALIQVLPDWALPSRAIAVVTSRRPGTNSGTSLAETIRTHIESALISGSGPGNCTTSRSCG